MGVSIDGRELFRNVALRVGSGEMLAIVGASGSGKTTLLNCLGLLMRLSEGSVLVDGEDACRWRRREVLRFWRERAAFIYQDSGVIKEQTLSYNVTLRGRVRAAERERMERSLAEVGLGGRSGERAAVLSGGECRRLGVARALYRNAEVIFADEPTASLDAGNRALVEGLLRRSAKRGAAVVVATHDAELAAACDGVCRL